MKTFAVAVSALAVSVLVSACMVMDGERVAVDQKTKKADEASVAVAPTEGGSATSDDAGAGPSTTTKSGNDASPTSATSVQCDGKTCAGATPFCCASSSTGTCVDATTTSCAGGRFLLRCDEQADCGAGEVCCMIADSDGSHFESKCTAKSACAGDPVQRGRVCKTPADCDGIACDDAIIDVDDKMMNITAGLCHDPNRPSVP